MWTGSSHWGGVGGGGRKPETGIIYIHIDLSHQKTSVEFARASCWAALAPGNVSAVSRRLGTFGVLLWLYYC